MSGSGGSGRFAPRYKAWEEAAHLVIWRKGEKKLLCTCALGISVAFVQKHVPYGLMSYQILLLFSNRLMSDLWHMFGNVTVAILLLLSTQLLLQCCYFFQHSYFCNVTFDFKCVRNFNVTFAMLLLQCYF